jgi:hypothetical protein
VVDDVVELLVVDEVLDEVVDAAVVEVEAVVDDPWLVVVVALVVVVDPAVLSSLPPSTRKTMGTAMAAATRMPIKKRAVGVRHQEPPAGAGAGGAGGGGGL